jgi:UDP-N-acetyl-D-glucosamine dehydrogenase
MDQVHATVHHRIVPVCAPVARRLVVAGLGRVGLALAHDAVRAGYCTVGLERDHARITSLIDSLAADDPVAATLRDAGGSGRWRVTGDPAAAGPFDVAVVAAGSQPVEPAEREIVEVTAEALAAHLRPAALVVIATTVQPARRGDLFAATVELLTGLRAGRDYALGFGLAHPGTSDPRSDDATIVCGVDAQAARRTEAFYGELGRRAAVVSPIDAAELVALLQRGLRRY